MPIDLREETARALARYRGTAFEEERTLPDIHIHAAAPEPKKASWPPIPGLPRWAQIALMIAATLLGSLIGALAK